mgnify:CR=1 FL=1
MSADVMELPNVIAEGETAHNPDELQALGSVICYRDPADVHHFLQTTDERIEQRIKRCGGRERAAKIQQAMAHVIALAIKQAVDLFLKKVFYRRGNHDDRGHRDDGGQLRRANTTMLSR